MADALKNAKHVARQEAKNRRLGLDPVAAGRALTYHVLRELLPPAGAVVAGFWPMDQEIDIRPLLVAFHERGRRVALPATPDRGNPLLFRLWEPGARLVPERFGTFRPTGDVVLPDMLLIPLLAFDLTGARLGYGGGFYDRTLPHLPGRMRVGCAFAAQQVDAVPIGEYDVRMNAIATENGVIRFEG